MVLEYHRTSSHRERKKLTLIKVHCEEQGGCCCHVMGTLPLLKTLGCIHPLNPHPQGSLSLGLSSPGSVHTQPADQASPGFPTADTRP